MFSIKNEELQAEISDVAAEVHSLKNNNDSYNYVWCGNPDIWADHNPILFPQVCSNRDKTLLINGIKYQTGNHGFIRKSLFTCIEHKEDELLLVTSDNEDTFKQYPFHFDFYVNYKLLGKRLIIKYLIKNSDSKTMPFCFGLHPGFACNHDFVDTKIVFEKEEDIGKEILLSKDFFTKYPTYHLYNPKSKFATLITGDKKIKVNFEGFNIVAIWSRNDFVCIEPWMSLNPMDPEIPLADVDGAYQLAAGDKISFEYSWEVE